MAIGVFNVFTSEQLEHTCLQRNRRSLHLNSLPINPVWQLPPCGMGAA